MSDVFDLLKQDHRNVEQLFEQFERSPDHGTAMRICDELSVHATVEEELVYPVFRSNVAPGLADEARNEHQQAETIIARIYALDAGDDELTSAVQELKGVIEHHVQEEENELFPKMAAAIPETVSSLGNDVVQRRKQLVEANQTAHGSVSDKPTPSGDPARTGQV